MLDQSLHFVTTGSNLRPYAVNEKSCVLRFDTPCMDWYGKMRHATKAACAIERLSASHAVLARRPLRFDHHRRQCPLAEVDADA